MAKALYIGVLDYSILGLIRAQPGSGYEIRRVFDTPLLRRFSSSPGSIYPALKRLMTRGFVHRQGSQQRGRFAISDTGRDLLVEWLRQPVTLEDVEERSDVLLLKFAFMEGSISHEARLRFLSPFAQAAAKLVDSLDAERASMDRVMPLHGRLTLDHRLAVAEVHRAWADRALKQLGES